MPVAAVEIEVSLQSYEQQTKDGRHRHSSLHSREKPNEFDSVIATCKELSIPVIAYSYVLSFFFSTPHSP